MLLVKKHIQHFAQHVRTHARNLLVPGCSTTPLSEHELEYLIFHSIHNTLSELTSLHYCTSCSLHYCLQIVLSAGHLTSTTSFSPSSLKMPIPLINSLSLGIWIVPHLISN